MSSEMEPIASGGPLFQKKIVVIDSISYWRDFASSKLNAAGCRVCAQARYDFASLQGCFEDGKPDLILFGCPILRSPELEWIDQLLAAGIPLVVFVTKLSVPEMRDLFLKGVKDVVEKGRGYPALISIVERLV